MNLINDRINLSVENGIASVLLNRPEKMNALDNKMFQALIMTADAIQCDKNVRVVVISGAGKSFCAGLDKENFSNLLDSGDDQKRVPGAGALTKRTRGIANDVQYSVWAWRELAVPVIAAVQGVALGGGFQLALAADMRYAAPQTKFSIMELKWGLIPDMSSSQLMRHLASEDIIRELTYTARLFSADEAKEFGFVTQIVDQPLQYAMTMARQIADRNPDAVRACKRIFNAANNVTEAEGLLMESIEQDKIIGSPNQREAVMAELQMRPPVFKD